MVGAPNVDGRGTHVDGRGTKVDVRGTNRVALDAVVDAAEDDAALPGESPHHPHSHVFGGLELLFDRTRQPVAGVHAAVVVLPLARLLNHRQLALLSRRKHPPTNRSPSIG
eukprot:9484596-Pyramimonas_sp.AAC.1